VNGKRGVSCIDLVLGLALHHVVGNRMLNGIHVEVLTIDQIFNILVLVCYLQPEWRWCRVDCFRNRANTGLLKWTRLLPADTGVAQYVCGTQESVQSLLVASVTRELSKDEVTSNQPLFGE